jgi:hypothetical protein
MLWLVGCMLALSSQAETTKREMWVWKDANGVTHYSDKPAPGAKKLEIVGTTPAAVPQPPPTPAASSAPPARPEREYTLFEFTRPVPDETFFGPESEVSAALSVEPGLMDGDQVTWYLDGNRVDEAQGSLSYTFKALPRGTHSLNAVIRDAEGVEKIRSRSRSFTVRQNTVDNPRSVGPTLKPKPTPLPAPTPPKAPPTKK